MHTKSIAIAAALLLTIGTASAAPVNLVTNGDFTSSTYTANSQFGSGQYQGGQGVTGWTATSGYDLYFTSAATASTQSALGQFAGSGLEKLYGVVPASPTGGAFVALDGDTGYNGTISQTITGLTVGTNYALNFDWAAGQLQSRTGNTTSSLTASLGSQSFSTGAVANPSNSFTGWMHQTFTFTATSASATLSFLSSGTPAGLPPIAALDGVSLVAVPEPASFAVLGLGLIGLGFMRQRRAAAI